MNAQYINYKKHISIEADKKTKKKKKKKKVFFSVKKKKVPKFVPNFTLQVWRLEKIWLNLPVFFSLRKKNCEMDSPIQHRQRKKGILNVKKNMVHFSLQKGELFCLEKTIKNP